jgi:hypothetical protein
MTTNLWVEQVSYLHSLRNNGILTQKSYFATVLAWLQTYLGSSRIRRSWHASRAFRSHLETRHCPLQQVSFRFSCLFVFIVYQQSSRQLCVRVNESSINVFHLSSSNLLISEISLTQCWWKLRSDFSDEGDLKCKRLHSMETSCHLQEFLWNRCRVFSFWWTNLHYEVWILDLRWIQGKSLVSVFLFCLSVHETWHLSLSLFQVLF